MRSGITTERISERWRIKAMAGVETMASNISGTDTSSSNNIRAGAS